MMLLGESASYLSQNRTKTEPWAEEFHTSLDPKIKIKGKNEKCKC